MAEVLAMNRFKGTSTLYLKPYLIAGDLFIKSFLYKVFYGSFPSLVRRVQICIDTDSVQNLNF